MLLDSNSMSLKVIECSECRFLCSKFTAEIVSPRFEILLNFFLFLKRGANSDSTISEVQDTSSGSLQPLNLQKKRSHKTCIFFSPGTQQLRTFMPEGSAHV